MEEDIDDIQLKANVLRKMVDFYKCKNKFLTSIHRCTFLDEICSRNTKYPKLWGISLRNNNINKLYRETFMALVNLTLINLDNNEIERLPIYVFKYNLKLTIINLNGNHLTHISKHIFMNNNKLIKIQLINNKIKHIVMRITHLQYLKRLYLHGNPLDSLDRITFRVLLLFHNNTNLIITFNTSSFTCYSMLSNMSWIHIYTRTFINSMLVYDKYKGTRGLWEHRYFNSDNNDFYNYLRTRLTNCNTEEHYSTS